MKNRLRVALSSLVIRDVQKSHVSLYSLAVSAFGVKGSANKH